MKLKIKSEELKAMESQTTTFEEHSITLHFALETLHLAKHIWI